MDPWMVSTGATLSINAFRYVSPFVSVTCSREGKWSVSREIHLEFLYPHSQRCPRQRFGARCST